LAADRNRLTRLARMCYRRPDLWELGSVAVFEDEEKRGIISMVCDEELVVFGRRGWSGEARAYDVSTGELKFKLQCNKLKDTPAPFSHDNIYVKLGENIILTAATNDNTVSIWDKSGTLLAQDLHKDKEKITEMERIKAMDGDEKERWFEEISAGMSEEEKQMKMMEIAFGVVPNEKKIMSFGVKEDTVFAGTENGLLLIIESVDGEWKITKEVEINGKVSDIEVDGNWAVLNRNRSLVVWDIEKGELVEGLKVDVGGCRGFVNVYPHVFLIGCGDDKTGVQIWNLEKGEMVRHLLKGEKEYEFVYTNGRFLTICEEIHCWISGEERMLKLAVYDTEELVIPVPEESLKSKCFEYSSEQDATVRAVTNSKSLIVDHDAIKFSIMEILQRKA